LAGCRHTRHQPGAIKFAAAFLPRMQAIAFSSRRVTSVLLLPDFTNRIASNLDFMNNRQYLRRPCAIAQSPFSWLAQRLP
jgi:hypothetical protein